MFLWKNCEHHKKFTNRHKSHKTTPAKVCDDDNAIQWSWNICFFSGACPVTIDFVNDFVHIWFPAFQLQNGPSISRVQFLKLDSWKFKILEKQIRHFSTPLNGWPSWISNSASCRGLVLDGLRGLGAHRNFILVGVPVDDSGIIGRNDPQKLVKKIENWSFPTFSVGFLWLF